MTLSKLIKSGMETILITGFGTAVLVSAHHLGRRQYNPNARLKDYWNGAAEAYKRRLQHSEESDSIESTLLNLRKQTISQPVKCASWISGVADLTSNEFAVVGIDTNRKIVWHTPMPERVHDILIQPLSQDSNLSTPHVAVMGRRPSEFFWILSVETGNVIYNIKADINRHFYGHACYSLDGSLLYVTENNTNTFAGIIGVYDVASGYKKIREFETKGIGPHELVMHPDGNTLVIANGGIKTEKASREELNIDSMQSSLVYINRHDGQILQQVYPEHNQMSVRHLSMHEDGTVAIGIQFQGERHLSLPLVLTHKRGNSGFTPLKLPEDDTKGWHRFHHYIASVAVDSEHNLLCVTSPIGGCVAVFDLTTGVMKGVAELRDCAGVAVLTQQVSNNVQRTDSSVPSFIVSDGQGFLTRLSVIDAGTHSNAISIMDKPYAMKDNQNLHVDKVHLPYAFDNHMQRV